MGATGGSIQSFTARGRTYAVTADCDASIIYGGYVNKKEPNGDGSTRTVKTRVSWSITGLALVCDALKDDQGNLQNIADATEDETFTVTLTNGQVMQGDGTIVDDIAWSSMNSVATIAVSGGGKLTQQK